MTPTIRDIAYQLRQGQLIALADETGWSIVADPIHDKAVEALLALRPSMPAGLSPTLLIMNTDQLGMYVVKVPDIAYDLVEFAEDPLTVIYEHGKNVSLRLWITEKPLTEVPAQAGELAVRRSLSEDVQRLIGSFSRGLLTIPFESLSLPPAVAGTFTEQFGTLPGTPKRPRILWLAVDGGIKFIRKQA
jgi:L-threonylcarbamoyladenylate synthase